MARIAALYRNRYLRFAFATILYLLMVIWLGNYWWLFGLPIIFDIYITRKVHWFFWRKRGVKRQKGWVEWLDALIFAGVAAFLIRLFFIEAFTIPSGSMEKTLLIGDYLFVSKVSYGPKMPNTPLAIPFTHHTMPFTRNTPAFLTWIQNPYNRRPGLGHIKRNDIVVFHFPEGDTVITQYPEQSYYNIVRELGREYVWRNYQLLIRPVDKRENYIKRCVAIPGDTLSIRAGQVMINGTPQPHFPEMQRNYAVWTDGTPINTLTLDKLGISQADRSFSASASVYNMPLTQTMAEALEKLPNVKQVEPYVSTDSARMNGMIFPHDAAYPWTEDFFGPLVIPRKGSTVALSLANLPIYRRIIEVYEHNKLEVKDSTILINGYPAASYTFGMDYYFMMGDNRHNSLDSRFWGFVPEDHVVGKAVFIWMSSDPERSFPFNIRWKRLFTRIR